MSGILFSVVIPTYNRAHLILNTIESVRKQTYKSYEIIVVDNCSTDNTEEALNPLIQNNQIKYIRNDKNYERAYSRNVGFKNAKGDYITLLDSDDILYPDCLNDAAEYINSNAGVRFFHSLYDLVDDNYKVAKRIKFPNADNPFKSLMEGNYISNIAVFYRKEVVEKIQFDENPVMTGVEDYDFVIRVLAETRSVGRINKINSGILLHPARSVNMEQWETTSKRIQFFIDKHLRSSVFLQCYGKYKKVFVSNLQMYLSGFLAVRGKSALAIRYILKAIYYDPGILLTIKCWRHFFVIIKYIFK
jgi:glycosyltransferase involved in cell wall biosynthesis